MYSTNAKHITTKELEDDQDPYLEWQLDFENCECPGCMSNPLLSIHEDFYLTIAKFVAEKIIDDQKLNESIKDSLIRDRMREYKFYDNDDNKINIKIKEDLTFIWPLIKDTWFGREMMAEILGSKHSP